MSKGKKIALFPEPGALGPVMNLVGIAQALREIGHTPIFILDHGLKGTVETYGFEERYVSSFEPMSPETTAKYWEDFIRGHLPHFRTSPYEQISTYVKACWEEIAGTCYWSQKELPSVLADIKPDLIINDNVALYPATEAAGCPWVRMVSCTENEITDPDIPPHLSGCGENDKACFEKYRARFEEVIRPIHVKFNEFVESCGHEPLPFPEFVLPSPYLNLLLHPKPLRFKRRRPLDPKKFQYLDGCVRQESEPYEVPTFKGHGTEEPLIYLSFGSLGVADVELIKRMIEVLGRCPYRVLVNIGDNMDEYGTPPDNINLASWYPQSAVLPHCDVIISHGGNNSLNETLYYGKLALLMPFAWDGFDSARRIQETGHGLGIDRYEWADEELTGAIERLLNDKAIHARVKETSEYMRAQDGRRKAARLIDELLNQTP